MGHCTIGFCGVCAAATFRTPHRARRKRKIVLAFVFSLPPLEHGHYLVGVYDNTPVENIYGFTKAGELAFAASSSMNPFRAFIQSPTSSSVFSTALFDEGSDGISQMLLGDDETVDVYSVSGRLIRKDVKRSEALKGLNRGVYIIGGTKIVK